MRLPRARAALPCPSPLAPLARLPRRSATEMSHNYVRYEELAAQAASDGTEPPTRSCCSGARRFANYLLGGATHEHRVIHLNAKRPTLRRHCRNVINNQKFSLLSFLPKVLYEQFKFFFNLYFLVVAVSQFFPPLKVRPPWPQPSCTLYCL
jgi:hypothetical protein